MGPPPLAEAAMTRKRRLSLAAAYLGLNVVSAVSLIAVNKVILSRLGFHFTYTLTFFHTIATVVGMDALAAARLYERKPLPAAGVAPLALAYVSYVALSNLSLKLNTVSFYTISKVAVAPAVLLLEFLLLGARATLRVIASVAVVCVGIGISTVTDTEVGGNVLGIAVALCSILATALYQTWAGSKQKDLGASSAQLLREYTPLASVMMGVLVGVFEPVGFPHRLPGSVLGFQWTPLAAGLVLLSCCLGTLVSLSTFLVIGVTSSLTYTVVGHIKTVLNILCGVLLFGDDITGRKLAGVVVAMAGIIWFSQLKSGSSPPSARTASERTASADQLLEARGKAASSHTDETVWAAVGPAQAASGSNGGTPLPGPHARDGSEGHRASSVDAADEPASMTILSRWLRDAGLVKAAAGTSANTSDQWSLPARQEARDPSESDQSDGTSFARAGSTTDSTSPGFGAGGDPLRRMAVPSETASTCSSDSAIMDVVKASAGGGDYAMTEGHSPATHSQAGAEFSSEREDRFPFGLPPGVKPHGLDSVTMSVASMDVDRAMLSPSASPQTSGQPWSSSQHPAPSPQRRSSRTQSPPRGPADPRQPSEDDARPGSDDEPHAAAAPPGWPGAAVAQPQQQQQQMQQALPHPGWPQQTAGHQDQHSGRASPQHDQQQREHQQQREQQQLERRQRREARRQSPAFTPSHCPPAPVPMPHPLQLQYQQQCLQDPLFAHPRYRKICDLNRGAHGFVQRAIDMQTGEEVACKFIERGRKWKPKHLLRELVNQKLCAAHPHIVHLREAFLTPHHLGIAMEYADSGDLLDFIDTFAAQGLTAVPEADARRVFQQMMVAVDYCHRLGIANRDIKLDNVLLSGLDPQLVKLCDFGYSKDGDLESACKTTCGTPEYMAPEVLLGDAYDGQRVDMWSCGCSLYILLVGNYPFRSMADNGISHVKRMQAMFPRIMAGAYTAIPTGSPEVRDLIHRLLRPNPVERLTMAEVFAHPWFQMDLADGALQLNDTLLAAVGADYAASGDLQERIDILQQAESGGNGQTVAELVALVNAAVEPLHHEFFDTRRRPSGLTVATR